MKNTLFLSLFFLTSLAFAGKKYEDQVIERITCPTQKCEDCLLYTSDAADE